MTPRVRQAIAVALVATALASDRSLAAAQAQHKPDRLPESKNLVTRLTQQLRRVVVGVKIQMIGPENRFAPVSLVVHVESEDTLRVASRLNVLLLNLPPPLA